MLISVITYREGLICGYQSIGIGVYALDTSGLQFWVEQGFCTIDIAIVNEHQRAILRLTKHLLSTIIRSTVNSQRFLISWELLSG